MRTCLLCHCTDEEACLDHDTKERCSWATETLCSMCNKIIQRMGRLTSAELHKLYTSPIQAEASS